MRTRRREHTQYYHSGMIMVADIHESERAASCHGLFMGYIARFLPSTRVLTPLLPCRSTLSRPLLLFSAFTFSFFALSLFIPLSNAPPSFRPRNAIREEKAVGEDVFYACGYRLFCSRIFSRDTQGASNKKEEKDESRW